MENPLENNIQNCSAKKKNNNNKKQIIKKQNKQLHTQDKTKQKRKTIIKVVGKNYSKSC